VGTNAETGNTAEREAVIAAIRGIDAVAKEALALC
jgi:hypothetical protein